jgi:hypothetical protein
MKTYTIEFYKDLEVVKVVEVVQPAEKGNLEPLLSGVLHMFNNEPELVTADASKIFDTQSKVYLYKMTKKSPKVIEWYNVRMYVSSGLFIPQTQPLEVISNN